MALVGLKKAAYLTGKNQSTIHRAMTDGRLSFTKNEAGERIVETSELNRVFEIKNHESNQCNDAPMIACNDVQLAEIKAQLQIEQSKNIFLEQKINLLEEIRVDLQHDRDNWRGQAERATLLLQGLNSQPESIIEPEQKTKAQKGFFRRLFGR